MPRVRPGARVGWMHAVRGGLAQARQHTRLVVLVWALFFALATVASWPAWRWWDRALSEAPEGDRLLDGLNIAVLAELVHYDRSATVDTALGLTWLFLLIAVILNPFVSGGILGLLQLQPPRAPRPSELPWSSPAVPDRRVTRRFVQEGMRFYWPFARVLLVAGFFGMLGTTVILIALVGIEDALSARGWERATLWLGDITILTVALAFGLTSLVVDLARIHIVRSAALDAWDPRAWANLKQGARFLRRNVGAVLGLAASFVLLFAAAVAIYLLIAYALTPKSWPVILLAIVWQQLFSLLRTGLRVAMLGAQARLVETRLGTPVSWERKTETDTETPVYELPTLG
jgi:hypothetical protein